MIRYLSILLFSILCSCSQQASWNKALHKEVAALGAYNWIVIAEQAYPAPGRPSAHMISSPNQIPRSVEDALQAIEDTGHIRPRIYTTRESYQIDDNHAPGISYYRTELTHALHGRSSQKLPQRSLESMLRASRNGNRVLIIKTPTALPYANVYIELESGYWDGDSETTLRASTRSSDTPKLPPIY